jgi:hypothetical protein
MRISVAARSQIVPTAGVGANRPVGGGLMTPKNPDSPGVKAAKTKGPIERRRAAKMARRTMKHGKDDVKNPYSKSNYYGHRDRSQ